MRTPTAAQRLAADAIARDLGEGMGRTVTIAWTNADEGAIPGAAMALFSVNGRELDVATITQDGCEVVAC